MQSGGEGVWLWRARTRKNSNLQDRKCQEEIGGLKKGGLCKKHPYKGGRGVCEMKEFKTPRETQSRLRKRGYPIDSREKKGKLSQTSAGKNEERREAHSGSRRGEGLIAHGAKQRRQLVGTASVGCERNWRSLN